MRRVLVVMILFSFILFASCSSAKNPRYDESDKRTWWCEEYEK